MIAGLRRPHHVWRVIALATFCTGVPAILGIGTLSGCLGCGRGVPGSVGEDARVFLAIDSASGNKLEKPNSRHLGATEAAVEAAVRIVRAGRSGTEAVIDTLLAHPSACRTQWAPILLADLIRTTFDSDSVALADLDHRLALAMLREFKRPRVEGDHAHALTNLSNLSTITDLSSGLPWVQSNAIRRAVYILDFRVSARMRAHLSRLETIDLPTARHLNATVDSLMENIMLLE